MFINKIVWSHRYYKCKWRNLFIKVRFFIVSSKLFTTNTNNLLCPLNCLQLILKNASYPNINSIKLIQASLQIYFLCIWSQVLSISHRFSLANNRLVLKLKHWISVLNFRFHTSWGDSYYCVIGMFSSVLLFPSYFQSTSKILKNQFWVRVLKVLSDILQCYSGYL